MKKYFYYISLALIFLYGCSKPHKLYPVSNDQTELLKLLPYQTEFLIYADFNNIRKSDYLNQFLKNSFKNRQSGKWLKDFENKTGVGLQSGVKEIMIATSWENNNSIIVRFDENLSKIKNYFNDKNKFDIDKSNGKTIYHPKNNIQTIFTFVNDSLLLILNNNEYLKNISEGSSKSLAENKNFIRIIENIHSKKYYWLATDNGSYAAELFNRILLKYKKLPVKSLIKTIRNITLSVDIKNGLNIESVWGCESSKDAKLLATAIRGALSMDILIKENYELGKVLDKTEVDVGNNNIYLDLQLTKDDISALKDFAQKNLK